MRYFFLSTYLFKIFFLTIIYYICNNVPTYFCIEKSCWFYHARLVGGIDIATLLPKVSWQISYFNTYISWYFCIAFCLVLWYKNWIGTKKNKNRTNRFEHLKHSILKTLPKQFLFIKTYSCIKSLTWFKLPPLISATFFMCIKKLSLIKLYVFIIL